MKKADMPIGTTVVLRGWRTVPNTIRLAKVVEHESFAVGVQYLYGEDLPMHLIQTIDGGPRTESPARGETRRVKLGDVLRVATPEDHDQEQYEWAGIHEAFEILEQMLEQKIDAVLLPQWPARIQVLHTVEQARAMINALEKA